MRPNIANTAYPPHPASPEQAAAAAAEIARARAIAEFAYDVVITQAVRVCFDQGLSQRQTAAALHLSKSDVSRIARRVGGSGWGWEISEDLHDQAMETVEEAWSTSGARAVSS